MPSFNANNFLKDSLISPVDRIIKDTSQRLSYKASDDLGDFASRILFGGAKNSTKSASSLLGNAIVSGLAAEFFGSFNNETSRLTRDQILNNRENSVSVISADSTRAINQANANSNVLYFPSNDLGKYKMSFGFTKYVRPAPGVTANTIIAKTIFLPIPRNLEEQHNMEYKVTNLGAYGNFADMLQQSAAGEGGALTTAAAVAKPGAQAGISSLRNNITGQAKKAALSALISDSFLGIVSQAFGITGNPAPSVLFDGISLRQHQFSWIFAPESEQESKNLREIINYFKAASLPVTPKDTTAFLEYPLMCKVKLHPWADEYADDEINMKTGLYTFKHCMVKSVSINYAPDGSPAFFGETSEPAYVKFDISLLEIEYFTANQFGREGRNFEEEIGGYVENVVEAGKGVIQSFDQATTPDNQSNIQNQNRQEIPNSEKSNNVLEKELQDLQSKQEQNPLDKKLISDIEAKQKQIDSRKNQ